MHGQGKLMPALAALIAVVVALNVALARSDNTPGRIGPALLQTANGRVLHPAGRMTTIGDFPTGGALAPDGRFYWAVDAGHGRDDVQIVDVATGAVRQVLPLPGAYVGVAFSPDGGRAYVSGEPKGDSKPVGPTRGNGGDVIHVFDVDQSSGRATESDPITIPRTSGGLAQQHAQNLIPGYQTPGPGASQALDWPEGLAVTPDGSHLLVALNQADRVAIIDLPKRSVQTVQVGAYPYGVAIDRNGRFAYVTSELDGSVAVVDIAARNVADTIPVGGAGGGFMAHAEGIVADPHRDRVYVAVASRDAIAFVDTASRKVERYVSVAEPEGVGAQPVALAIAPDGRTLYSADSGEDAVAAISLGSRPALLARTVVVAPRPSAILRHYRRTHRLLRGRLIRACGGPSGRQERAYERALIRRSHDGRAHLHPHRASNLTLPRVRSCNDGTLYGLSEGTLIGRIPTAAYPTAVAVTPDGSKLIWVAAKGLGAGPNPGYGSPFANSDAAPYGTYVIDMLLGRVGVLARPTDVQAQALNATAQADRLPPQPAPPSATPVVGPGGGPSQKIKYVFYIVKENRTYDQLFGSDPRGDGDPQLELFDDNGVHTPAGGVTPNAHALTRTFPLLDHFYADSEVSVDGHIITSGGYAIDYVQKALHPNYSGRGRVDEFGSYPITYPPNYFVFDQAVKQGVSFINYGEHSGTLAPDNRPGYNQVQSNSPISYPFNFGCDGLLPIPNNDVTRQANCNTDSGTLGPAGVDLERSRFDYFQANFNEQLSRGRVPAFNYITLPNDHTNGAEVGAYTPRALVADNDLGLGQFVDLISHSAIWSQSAIFVVEDDSQDGADHVDAHRMPAYVISPFARRGVVVHTRYDQLSVLRTIELILGLKPLSLFDATATPMYDAFISGAEQPNTAPYDAITPEQSLNEVNTAAAAARAAGPLASALPWNTLDAVPQELFDRILYHDVYGPSYSPSPGPNASALEAARAQGALELLPRGVTAVRAWLNQTAGVRSSGTGAQSDG